MQSTAASALARARRCIHGWTHLSTDAGVGCWAGKPRVTVMRGTGPGLPSMLCGTEFRASVDVLPGSRCEAVHLGCRQRIFVRSNAPCMLAPGHCLWCVHRACERPAFCITAADISAAKAEKAVTETASIIQMGCDGFEDRQMFTWGNTPPFTAHVPDSSEMKVSFPPT